jgi:hypothetical protein
MLEKGSIQKWTIQRHWKFWTPDTEDVQTLEYRYRVTQKKPNPLKMLINPT